MDEGFIKIAVTVDYLYPGEAADIAEALRVKRFDYVHVRKPDSSAQKLKDLIDKVDLDLRERLTLHDHFEIAGETGVGGVHLNRRNPCPPAGWKGRVSKSCHTAEECQSAEGYDYVTLSPIYASISKPG